MGGACSKYETRNAPKTLIGKHEGKDHLGYLRSDEEIILRWM